MTSTNKIILGVTGVAVLGGGGYFLYRALRPKVAGLPLTAGVTLSAAGAQARDLGAAKTTLGPKAVAQSGSSGLTSTLTQAMSGPGGAALAKLAAGGGGTADAATAAMAFAGPALSAAKSVGSSIVSGLKSLKFW